jgi:cytochrome c-type biogenesis protein CcmF
MCVATLAVLLGTLYPLVIDALGAGKLSVGPPYFNVVFAPIMVPLIFIMVPGPLLRWREAKLVDILPDLIWPALGACVAAALMCWTIGLWSLGALAGFWLGAWVALAGVQQMVLRLKRPGRIGGSFWGMQLAHLGLAIIVMGVTGVRSFEVERDVRMGVGDEVQIQDYTFRLLGLQDVKGPNYQAVRARVQVLKNGQEVKVMLPEKRRYYSSAMPMTEAAIDSGFLQDLYVSLGDALPGDTPQWSMRVYYKPFVPWLWVGVLVMVLGGFLAALDRRYRGQTALSEEGDRFAQGAHA